MKKIVAIILLNLFFNSCVKKEQIIGTLLIDKSARVLNLVLENKSDIDYYFSYKYLLGCPTSSNESCNKNECLKFELLKVSGYQNRKIQKELFNRLNKLYIENGFLGFTKTDSLMAKEYKGGMNAYFDKNFFLLPKQSKTIHAFAIENHKEGCSYKIKFENISFNGTGQITSKRKLIQQEFYNYGEVDNFKPFEKNLSIDSLIIN